MTHEKLEKIGHERQEKMNKLLGHFIKTDKISKDAAPPIKKAVVAAPAPTKPTTTGWVVIPVKK